MIAGQMQKRVPYLDRALFSLLLLAGRGSEEESSCARVLVHAAMQNAARKINELTSRGLLVS